MKSIYIRSLEYGLLVAHSRFRGATYPDFHDRIRALCPWRDGGYQGPFRRRHMKCEPSSAEEDMSQARYDAAN